MNNNTYHSKLFGRDEEINRLKDAFSNICNGQFEVLLIKGLSGTGKTALIQNTFTTLTYTKGFFISGKFDQYVMNVPYLPFVQAFAQMIHYILSESKEKIEGWRKLLKSILGNNSGIIATMIPEIELILGPQKIIEDFDIEKVRRRFERVFIKFLQAFATKEHPMVFFLDDLQWVDEASLNLIKVIVSDTNNQYLLLIGSYREEEVPKEHKVASLINKLTLKNIVIKELTLTNLNLSSTYDMIRSYLDCFPNSIKKIADEVFLKTFGNPFYIEQILALLKKEKVVLFEHEHFDIDKALDFINKIEQNHTILDMIFERIQRVLKKNIYLIKLVACIGHSFDLQLFAIIIQDTLLVAANNLKELVDESLLLPMSSDKEIITVQQYVDRIKKNELDNIHYEFIHDKIHEVAYDLLREDEKKEIHLEIGRKLVNDLTEDEIKKNIFRIISHMNYGLSHIVDNEEKVELAKLNYMAGVKAKNTSALHSAEQFFEIGLKVLIKDNNQLAFNLHYELYQCKFLNGKLDEAHRIFGILLKRSTNNIEKSRVYILNSILLSCVSHYQEAIQAGIKALSYVDISLKDKHYNRQLLKEILKSFWLFRNNRLKQLHDLPAAKSEKTLLALRTMVQLAPAANLYNEDLFALIILKMANIAAYEKSKYSPIGFAGFALFSGSIFGNYKKGKIVEQLTLELCEQYDDQVLSCMTYFIVGTFITHWTSHGRVSLQYAYEAFNNGMESGEFFFTGYSMTTILEMKYVLGKSMEIIQNDCLEFYNYAVSMDFDIVLDLINMFNQFTNILKSDTISIDRYISEDLEEKLIEKDSSEIMTYYILKAQLLILKGDYKEALIIEEKAYRKLKSILGYMMYAEHIYYYSLAITLTYDELSISKKKTYYKILKSNQKKMKKIANHCEENFRHKYLFIQAEIARINNKHMEAMSLYDKAIESASHNEYVQNIAIINECAARYYKAIGRENVARGYINEAYNKYMEWGAIAKAKQLYYEWEDMIYEIHVENQENNPSVVPFNPTDNIEQKQESLEVRNIMTAYYNIEKETDIHQILLKLLEGVMDITGADKGYILFEEDEKLHIKVNKESFKYPYQIDSNQPLDLSKKLPKRVIRYVARTNDTIMLNEDMFQSIFSKDTYIMNNRPASIACMPLMHQGISLGVIYLEINMTTESFNTTHIEALNILLDKVMNADKLKLLIKKGQKDNQIDINIQQLTRREQEVLKLLGHGKSNKEIAEELNLTVNTIKTHSVNIYNKLRVNKRIQAVIKAKELGLIED